MTDGATALQARAIQLAALQYPDRDGPQAVVRSVLTAQRLAFEAGYLAARREDDEPQDDDVVLRCYYPSGTSDIVWSVHSKSMARWMIGNSSNRVGWPDVLAKGYVRRVPLVEQP